MKTSRKSSEKYWAFLVGISKYEREEFKELAFADNSARRLKRILKESRDYNDKTICVLTSNPKNSECIATRNNILIKFSEFLEKLEKSKKLSTLLIYFVCHGGSYEGMNYIFPKDAFAQKKGIDPKIVEETSISINSFIRQLKLPIYGRKNFKVFFIIDACRKIGEHPLGSSEGQSSSVSKPQMDDSELERDILAELTSYRSEIIDHYPSEDSFLFSCSSDQWSHNYPEGSIFSHQLLKVLEKWQKNQVKVTYGNLVYYLQRVVPEIAKQLNKRQVPNDQSSTMAHGKLILGSDCKDHTIDEQTREKKQKLIEKLADNAIMAIDTGKTREELEIVLQQLEEETDPNRKHVPALLERLPPEALLKIGRIYRELEKHQEATWFFKTVLATPGLPDKVATKAHLHLAHSHLILGKLKTGQENYEGAASKSVSSSDLKEWEQELKSKNALKTSEYSGKNLAGSWFSLGLARYKRKMFKDAEKAYRNAISHQQDYTEAWNNLGELLHYVKQKFQDAEEAYRYAILYNPQYSLAWYNMGNLLRAKVNQRSRIFRRLSKANARLTIKQAEEAYIKAINTAKDKMIKIRAQVNLGVILNDQKHHESAEFELENSIQLLQEIKQDDTQQYFHALACWNLGIVHENKSLKAKKAKNKDETKAEVEKAKEEYSKALKYAANSRKLKKKAENKVKKLEKRLRRMS